MYVIIIYHIPADSPLTMSQLVSTTKQKQSPMIPGYGQLDDRTGQRRSPKPRYKDDPSPLPSPAEAMLEDSTDGVASILKKKLQQLDLDHVRGVTSGDEDIMASAQRSADEGHNSDTGAQPLLDGDEKIGGKEGGGEGVTQG